MKKIIYTIICITSLLMIFSCSSSNLKDSNIEQIIIDHKSRTVSRKVPKWVELFDKNNYKPIIKYFPELKNKIVILSSEEKYNLNTAFYDTENVAKMQYFELIENDIFNKIKDSQNYKHSEIDLKDLSKQVAERSNINGLDKFSEYWVKYKYVNKQTKEEIKTSYRTFVIYCMDEDIFYNNVQNCIETLNATINTMEMNY